MELHFPLSVWALGVACLFMFGLGFVLTLNGAARRRFFLLPIVAQKAHVVVFMATIVAMPLVPQARYEGAAVVSTVAGVVLLACVLGIWASALRAMGGVPSIRQARGLVTGGVYGVVRNPLYTANSLALPGLGLLTQSLPALLFTPAVFGLFLVQSIL